MGVYTQKDPLEADSVRRGLVAAGTMDAPPSEWFQDPKLTGPTPLTITADGRVFGHLAAWNSTHIGMPGRIRPPRSHSNYAYFKTGVVACADGTEQPVGQITLAGGHAPLSASADQAKKHYDDTNSALIDVNAGEDEHGIWLAGALRASATVDQIRALKASAPSGDWRPIGRGLELVAACQVNVPGFPIARARTASGECMALVAAGALDMAVLQMRRLVGGQDEDLREQVQSLTASVHDLRRSELRRRVESSTPTRVETVVGEA